MGKEIKRGGKKIKGHATLYTPELLTVFGFIWLISQLEGLKIIFTLM
jgi:hypothetical protein